LIARFRLLLYRVGDCVMHLCPICNRHTINVLDDHDDDDDAFRVLMGLVLRGGRGRGGERKVKGRDRECRRREIGFDHPKFFAWRGAPYALIQINANCVCVFKQCRL